MQISQIPTRFLKSFGEDAGPSYIRSVPVNSQIGIQDGAASLTDGFPPLNFVPPGAGGVPPFGQDFNGILNQITLWSQWQNAGAPVTYNAGFAASIGGYPQGAIVAAASGVGNYWLNLVDDNSTDPDAGGANWRFISSPSGRYSFSLASPPGSPIQMNVGDRVIISFAGQTSIPLSIASVPGIYRAIFAFTDTTTTGEASAWLPNDATFSNAFSAWTIAGGDRSLNGLGNATTLASFTPLTVSPYVGNVPQSNVQFNNRNSFSLDIFNGPGNPPDTINGIGPNMLDIVFSTFTTGKMIKYTGGITGGPVVGFSKWNDVSTPWTSLGTFQDQSAALTGSVVVTREM